MVNPSVSERPTGGELGARKGSPSQHVTGEARFLNWPFDVQVEGQGVCRLLDPMASNGGSPTNTPPAAEVQPPLVVPPGRGPDDDYGHLLLLTLAYAHGDADREDSSPSFLILETPIRFTGPENETWSPILDYSGVVANVWEPGDYTMEFDAFDLELRELLPKTRAEQLARYAKRRLERARRTAENALEDLDETAGRLERDVRRAASNLDDRARAAVEDARERLAEAQRQAAEARDHLGRAVQAYDDGSWMNTAVEGASAALDGAQASRDALGALRDLSSEGAGSITDFRSALEDALRRAARGLEMAEADVRSATSMSN